MSNIVEKYFKENENEIRNYIVSLLKELIKIKSVNVSKNRLSEFPYLHLPGEESKVVEIIKNEFEQYDIEYEIHEGIKGRANIIGKYGHPSKTLMVAFHTDIVPEGDGWESDPYEAYEKNGKIYGRGAIDNKGPLCCGITALKILKKLNVKLKGCFRVAAIAGEEFKQKNEMDPGLEYLLKNNLIHADYVIVPDIGENMQKIDIAEKGRLQIKVVTYGKQAHGSTPEQGKNAIYPMAEFLLKLKKLNLPYTPHPYLKNPTINPGVIRAGSASNIVPARCELVIDVRIVPGQTPESVLSEFKSLANSIKAEFEFQLESASLPHEVSKDCEIVNMIQKATKKVLGFTPEPFGMGGGTFAKGFNTAGIQAVGFGPGDDAAFHVANEYVEIQQLVDFTKILCILAEMIE